MICYKCNRRIGTQWVKVCPYCGNEEVEAENLGMRAKIERFFGEGPVEEQSVAEKDHYKYGMERKIDPSIPLLRKRIRELEEAVRYWSGYDDVDFAIRQAKARGELAKPSTSSAGTKP